MKRRNFDRLERVGDLIQRTLASRLLHDMHDKRFQLVTITGVSVARDLSYAKIYVSFLINDEKAMHSILDALNRAAGSFRYYLAKEIKLRIIPELKFIYDESTARGFKLDDLINSAIKKSDAK